jgi:Initiation factor 2 subunit family
MHPIERLRFVARASDEGPTLLVREAAGALASFADDPAALVTACRRLVDRQPHAAAIWWLAARVLGSPDPDEEAWIAAGELDGDATSEELRHLIPNDATVLVLGWPEQITPAIARRGDLTVLVADSHDEGTGLVRRLQRSGHEPTLIDERALGAAAAEVDLVLLEAVGLGQTGIVATMGSRSAAAAAHHAGVPVWAVAGVGRVLPGRLWDAYLRRLDDDGDPWERDTEFVPLDLLSQTVSFDGLCAPNDAPRRADCPIPPELLKSFD